MSSHWIIAGLRGVGKSTFARRLALFLEMPLIDVDHELVKQWNEKVTTLYLRWGEKEFRKKEGEVLAKLLEKQPSVIALGGGSYMTESNRKIIAQLGRVICLHMEKEELQKRWQKLPPFLGNNGQTFDEWEKMRLQKLKLLTSTWLDVTHTDPLEAWHGL